MSRYTVAGSCLLMRRAVVIAAMASALVGVSQTSAFAAEAPIAAYSFDEGTGTTAEDITGAGHTATIENATWARGKYGGSLAFNGTNACVKVPVTEDLQATEEFTVEAWVRPEGTGANALPVIAMNDEESKGEEAQIAYELFAGNGQTPKGWVRKGGASGSQGVYGEGPMPEKAWSHIALTDDGSVIRIYVNGVLGKEENSTNNAPLLTVAEGPLSIGCGIEYGSYKRFKGRIDEVRVYNRALGAGELEPNAGPDKTPPIISLTGSLTEGLKKGTSKYGLEVVATDGSPGTHGVGVGTIDITLDGEQVESVHQNCPERACTLDLPWTLDTEVYGFKPHEVTISAIDQAGNVGTTVLPVAAPNGSIPACNLEGENSGGTPDVEEELSGGGSAATFFGAEGVTMTFKSPPEGFQPNLASDEELELYGFPPRPPKEEPEAREKWEETVGQATSTSKPGGCMSVAGPKFKFLAPPDRETSHIWSGYDTLAPKAPSNQWRAARTHYRVPILRNTCPAPASLASWVGIGGQQGKGFFQAGTAEPHGIADKPGDPAEFEVSAFTEYFRGGEEEDHPTTENPFFFNLKIEFGDRITSIVEWKPALQKMYMRVTDLTTHESTPGAFIDPHFGDVYDGQSVDFIAAEVEEKQSTFLQDFGTFNFLDNEALVTSGNVWKKMGELGGLSRVSLRRLNAKKEPSGQVLASPGAIFLDNESFTEHWLHCHE